MGMSFAKNIANLKVRTPPPPTSKCFISAGTCQMLFTDALPTPQRAISGHGAPERAFWAISSPAQEAEFVLLFLRCLSVGVEGGGESQGESERYGPAWGRPPAHFCVLFVL